MPVFALLVKFSSQEVTSMSNTRKAIDETSKIANELKIRIIGTYAMKQPYDILLIYEAGDEKVAAKLATNIASKWGDTPEIWTLITKEELAKIPDKSRGLA